MMLLLRRYNGAIDCVRKTVANEGISALWKGLEPALWRQATYGSMRYGFYAPIKEMIQPGVSKQDMPLWAKIVAGGGSGALSSAVANPTDLVKVRPSNFSFVPFMFDSRISCHSFVSLSTVAVQVRMQGAGSGAGGGHQYRWFLSALIGIIKTDGFAGLCVSLA